MQPHSAAEVLHNEYGDCKDKHTLLASMLKSVGIASDAVLIHSTHELDPDVPSPSQFDHLITAAQIGPKTGMARQYGGSCSFGLVPGSARKKRRCWSRRI